MAIYYQKIICNCKVAYVANKVRFETLNSAIQARYIRTTRTYNQYMYVQLVHTVRTCTRLVRTEPRYLE